MWPTSFCAERIDRRRRREDRRTSDESGELIIEWRSAMSNRLRVLSFGVLMLYATACVPSGKGRTNSARSTVAFVGANILPLTGNETVLRDHTVIVRDGRIAEMGPSRRIAVPADAIRISASGQYLMPALADMHVHLEHFDDPVYLQLFLINGVAFVRSMDGRPFILN